MLSSLQGRIFGLLLIGAGAVCALACSTDASESGPGSGGASSSGAGLSGAGSSSSSGGALSGPSGGSGASSGGSGTVVGPGGGSSAQAGASTGGSVSAGGSASAGGMVSSGGNSSMAGAGGSSASTPSAGCGKTTKLMNGRASIDVGGAMREYILALPTGYDSSRPYRLVFGWHPLGGSASQVANGGYYGLKSKADQLILVAPEGLPFSGSSLGWGNKNGEDLAFLQAMLTLFRGELCVDEARIFSTGFSFGGMMSYAVGCSPMSMMRAIAPMAGNSMVSGCVTGDRPVAMMGFHGDHDSVVDIAGGRTARDVFVKRNGCSSETMPVTGGWCDGVGANYKPCSCVSYQGCKAGYPVIWCEYNADHMPAPSSGATLWDFFSQF